MNVRTPNKQESPHLFSMVVIYTVSLHLCQYKSQKNVKKMRFYKNSIL